MITKIFVSIINFYKIAIAPYKFPCCRYYPSCSSYMEEAIKKKGAFKGSTLGLWRILRCNPFARGGYDPI